MMLRGLRSRHRCLPAAGWTITIIFPDFLRSPEQRAELAQIAEIGPDPERDGIVRWRSIDLQQVIKERFGVDYHERHVGTLLKDFGFVRLSGRPQHPQQDER